MADEPRQVGTNPPDLYQGLNLRYWLLKWLPDPAPDVRDTLILADIYALTSALSDETIRNPLMDQARGELQKRLA